MCASKETDKSTLWSSTKVYDRSVSTDLKQKCIIVAFFSSSNRFGKETLVNKIGLGSLV